MRPQLRGFLANPALLPQFLAGCFSASSLPGTQPGLLVRLGAVSSMTWPPRACEYLNPCAAPRHPERPVAVTSHFVLLSTLADLVLRTRLVLVSHRVLCGLSPSGSSMLHGL